MKLLLDSHVILWLALVPTRISAVAAEAISTAEGSKSFLEISAASLYEIAYLIRAGRIMTSVPDDVFLSRLKTRFKVHPISSEIAVCAAQFSHPMHGNPMDRIIAATALIENCTLITADSRLRDSGVCRTIW